ncbi:ribonuclease III domain-containing protein [Endogone sp. FLAS-F59071]|nr:ribonuclease III domain-containing protein [Endogone sp. FLAS-F59071]|eukprot:RUS15651.1 ribonuclease III domain-containing protein [Endogone sp. FLAS-F59071]
MLRRTPALSAFARITSSAARRCKPISLTIFPANFHDRFLSSSSLTVHPFALLHTRPFDTDALKGNPKALTAALGVQKNPAALAALGARLNLPLQPALLQQAVTHWTVDDAAHNSRLNFIGKRVLGLYVSEYIHIRYPLLPIEPFTMVVGAYTGDPTLSRFGMEVGLQEVVRWAPPKINTKSEHSLSSLVAKSVRAIIGALHHKVGYPRSLCTILPSLSSVHLQNPALARSFVHSHILSREIDVKELIKFDNPKRYLTWLMRRQGKEEPLSRLLKETGRTSSAPVFLVGVFSGEEKLGEGYGSSLKMAEYRAAENALRTYYIQEVKDFTLPSDVMYGGEYQPNKIGDTQVIV